MCKKIVLTLLVSTAIHSMEDSQEAEIAQQQIDLIRDCKYSQESFKSCMKNLNQYDGEKLDLIKKELKRKLSSIDVYQMKQNLLSLKGYDNKNIFEFLTKKSSEQFVDSSSNNKKLSSLGGSGKKNGLLVDTQSQLNQVSQKPLNLFEEKYTNENLWPKKRSLSLDSGLSRDSLYYKSELMNLDTLVNKENDPQKIKNIYEKIKENLVKFSKKKKKNLVLK